jgi:thiamine biosynthesis lipoprotein
LNGLGQGYATDRIADLITAHGFTHVLIDLGEQRALGSRPNGAPWLVTRFETSAIELYDGALATSEGSGCVLNSDGTIHHLFDPRTGRSTRHWRTITVHHRSAAVADALSTALSAADSQEISRLVASGKLRGAAIWAVDGSGREEKWRALM